MRLFLVCLTLVSSCLQHGALASPLDGDGGLSRRPILGAAAADSPAGVILTWIAPGSAAEKSGLRVGDRIVRIGARSIGTTADFAPAVRVQPVGRSVTFIVARAGVPTSVDVVMAEAPREQGAGFVTAYGALDVGGELHRTLLTHPAGVKRSAKPAVVLLIGGIGCYSVDVATDELDPYRQLAQDIARRGVASLRVEKSGVGDSQGGPCFSIDFRAESTLYESALQALLSDRDVDRSRIYLLGHSIGGLIAPSLAARHPVAGVIVAETVGRNWFEYELTNLRRQLALGGDSPEEIDAKLASKERCMHRLLVEKRDAAEIETAEPDCKLRNAYPVGAAYMQQVAAINIAGLWSSLPSLPVLAIFGTADFVVDENDLQRIVDIVNSKHPNTAEFVRLQGMEHRLAVAGSTAQAYQARVVRQIPLPYDHAFSDTVATWIQSRSPRIGGWRVRFKSVA
jgi:pimeloyl-ACP methyl ester carboxylesterase